MERIGFIGIGNMGNAMCQRLMEKGFKITAYDVKESAVKEIVGLGAEGALSPKEVAALCPIILLSLPNSKNVEEVVLGKDGIIQGGKKGTIVVDMTTGNPLATKRIAGILSEKGMEMFDAPVSGGKGGARQGTLSIMVGGKEKIIEKCQPILSALGKSIFYMGEIGSGHVMKAVNNYIAATSLISTSEAVVLATKAGLSPQKVVDVLAVSSGRSWATDTKFKQFILPRTFAAGFAIELMSKDVNVAMDLAKDLKVPMFLGNLVQHLWAFAVSQGRGGEDLTAYIKILEEWAKVEVKQ